MGERKKPVFKPDWSPELCYSDAYIGSTYYIEPNCFFRLWKNCIYDDDAIGLTYDLLLSTLIFYRCVIRDKVHIFISL